MTSQLRAADSLADHAATPLSIRTVNRGLTDSLIYLNLHLTVKVSFERLQTVSNLVWLGFWPAAPANRLFDIFSGSRSKQSEYD